MARRPVERPTRETYQQMRLELGEIDDAIEENSTITPDEARRRSETARVALETLNPSLTPTLTPSPLPEERGVKPEWMERYWELRDAGWPWRIACYIAWCASPRNTRWPKTQDDLATKVLGLTSDRQIGTWRRKNPTIDDVVTLLQAAPLFEHRADIYAALIDSASRSDHRSHQDRKLALELMGDYVPHLQVDSRKLDDMDDLSQVSEDELRKRAKLAGADA